MNYPITSHLRRRVPMITLSGDSYIRLTLENFLAVPLVHLLSGLDDDRPLLPKQGACHFNISGYTEWVSNTMPAITLGWDWGLDASQGPPLYVRLGIARSNIMLVNALTHDLGAAKTSMLLEAAIDALDWRKYAVKYIATRYVS